MNAVPDKPEIQDITSIFGSMKGLNTGAAIDAPDVAPSAAPDIAVIGGNETASPDKSKIEDEDEDDLEIGEQLDVAGAPNPVVGSTETSASHGSDAQANDETIENDENEVADTETLSSESSGPSVSAAQDEYNQRLAAAQAAQARSAGGGGGGAPGVSGLIAGTVTGIGKGLGGGFRVLKNGLTPNHDPSLPLPKSRAERYAEKTPAQLETYLRNRDDSQIREATYRDGFESAHDSIQKAKNATASMKEASSEFRDVLNRSDVKGMAEEAGTSIGDFVNGVNSGTIKAAAAMAAVQTLQQSTDFKAAEAKLVNAGQDFKASASQAVKSLEKLDTSFPGRADTNMRRKEISDLAEDVQDDELSKVSAKTKKMLDELGALAESLKQAIKKGMDFLASGFKQK